MKLVILILLVGILNACDSEPDLISRIQGQVVDRVTNDPVAGATVTIRGQELITDKAGAFLLRNVKPGSRISVERCGMEPIDSAIPTDEEDKLLVELEPVVTEGTVTSNLTSRPVRGAVVRGGTAEDSTNRAGAFELPAYCPEEPLRIEADGHETLSVKGREELPSEFTLTAGPGLTEEQWVRWESLQKWDEIWELVHPDALSYVTKEEWVQYSEDRLADGYQGIRAVVKSVDIITWTFPACSVADFGPKTYRRTAALSTVLYESAPSGGQTSEEHLLHLVQTPDGFWRWFPVAGCDVSV